MFKKNITAKFFLLGGFLLVILSLYRSTLADPFSGAGTGTELDPYIITSCTELQEMNLDLSAYYRLEGENSTIDCSATNPANDNFNPSGLWSDGKGFAPVGDQNTPFAGHLDGNHNTIDALYIDRTDQSFVGLFGAIESGSTVIDLGLTNVNISANQRVGALAGSLSGTVTSVYSTGSVTGTSRTGGLVGTHVNNNSWYNSSPLVYTWNGSEYKYIADVGNLLPKEVGNAVDLASVDKGDLVPKGNVYSMKVSEEYNEIVYFDELSLMTYDHAPGYSVAVPLNRMASTTDIKTVSDAPTNPLVSCTDMYGRNCLNELKDYDDKWSYKDKSFVNYWIMDFGDLSQATSSIQLLMRGARDYAASARMKSEGTYSQLRTVAVKDANGNWVQIYNKNDLGSDGTPRLRTIDLTGKFLTNDYHVKVGFDTFNANYFAVDTSPQVPVTVHAYHPIKADLSFRGFTEIDNTYYAKHNYSKVNELPSGNFKPQFGNFTKYGDVSPLLQSTNNQYVIMKGGDHMDIEFPYEVPEDGMERSVVLFNNAVYKHASNDGIDLLGKTVTPLPYAGMTDYTSATNGYPMTPENQSYINMWNTREYNGVPRHDRVSGSTIINSYSTATVHGNWSTGGLVGYNEKEIRNSYATGNVTANGNWDVGGLVGSNGNDGSKGWIHDSYATGNVTGGGNVGGLVGYNYATIERSYATGAVTAGYSPDYVGGLVGGYCPHMYCNDSLVNDSFWDTETTGVSTESEEGVGKTTLQMQSIDTYTSLSTPGLSNAWDFTGTENDDTGTDEIWKIDTANNGYPYLSWQVIVPNPVISNIAVAPATDSATFTWNTDATSTSKVFFSINNQVFSSTSETNLAPLVQSHSVTVSDLIPCTIYYYKVYSAGAYNNRTTSTASSFVTLGCSAGSVPDERTLGTVDTTTNATTTLSLTADSKYFTVATPSNFTSTSSSIVIQIKTLDSAAVLGSIGKPDNLSGVGNVVFDVKALVNATTTLDSFDLPVTITYHYSDTDIAGLDESTLKLYHYRDGEWAGLGTCIVNQDENIITCTAPHFSIFSLFGSVVTSEEGRNSGTSVKARIDNLTKRGDVAKVEVLKKEYGAQVVKDQKSVLTKDLHKGLSDQEVKALQSFLNQNGFTVTLSGPGSKGNETTLFGELTRIALSKFQKANNINPSVGNLGPKTRTLINSLILGSTQSESVKQDADSAPKNQTIYTRDLYLGMSGEDVLSLQKYLISKHTGVASEALAKKGVTGYFGPLTEAAVVEFQKANNINPQNGVFGPKTRSLIH